MTYTKATTKPPTCPTCNEYPQYVTQISGTMDTRRIKEKP